MIEAILFDLDNTLYSETNGMEKRVLERMNRFVADYLGLTIEETAIVRREGSRHYGTTLEWLMREKGFRNSETYFAAIHPEGEEEGMQPDPALNDLLASLPQKKAILTNAPREHAERVLRALGIAHCFCGITDIRSNGLLGKPHAESYLKALSSNKFSLDSTIYVDDLPKYVKGYLDLGGAGVLKDETDRFRELALPRIHSLAELPAEIERINATDPRAAWRESRV